MYFSGVKAFQVEGIPVQKPSCRRCLECSREYQATIVTGAEGHGKEEEDKV